MQRAIRVGSVALLVLALLTVTTARADDKASEQLQRAADLFAKQEYTGAQDALREVDRDKLSKDGQAEYDRLKTELPQAIAASEAAEETCANAEKAFAEGRWDDADKLYEAVAANKYARASLKEKATARREAVAEKKRLAQAAEPSGVVAAEPAAEPKEPTSAPAAAPEAAPPPPADTQRLTPIEEMRRQDSLMWQQAVAQARELSARAREAADAHRFVEARQLAELALQKIEAMRSRAEPASLYVAAKEAQERLKQEIATDEENFQRIEADRQRTEIKEQVEKRTARIEQLKREKIEQLFLTASQLRKNQQFSEAAEVLRQILAIDPANAKARDQLEIAEDYASLHVQKDWQSDLYKQTRSALVSAEEALIPWDYEVLYPKNWLELTARRTSAGIGTGDYEGDNELPRKLDEILPEFEFQAAPLEAVMEHLQSLENINIAVDWEDLANVGVEKERPVTIQLRNLPLRTVLKEVLSQVGGDVKLAYTVADGLLRVATKDKLSRNKSVLVYDIRDLLVNVPRFTNAARMDPAQLMSQPGGTGGGASGAGFNQLFQPPQQNERSASSDQPSNDIVERIMAIIRQTVEPDSWQDSGGGGGDASIRELNGQLIVYNTSEAHSQVRGLLDQLRATRALQIAVEARFLNVTSNFLEEFGVDLDFVFNSGTAGYDRAFTPGLVPLTDPFTGASVLVPRQYTRIGATPNVPGFGSPIAQTAINQPYGQAGFVPQTSGAFGNFDQMTPITAQQNSINLTDPSTLNTGVAGTFANRVANPALNIAGSFLDNLQVDFLIRATQANGRSSIVQAPRLVLFNGQRANISVGRSRQYVSSVTPQVAEGAVAVTPVINNAPSGSVLVVEGTISADRRYVTLTVETTQTDEPTFDRFQTQQASGSSPGIFVLLPTQSFVTINTTVSIPDGGTVLLGGLKQVGEIEVEAGVPVLSKIPVIKRAFTNKTTVKDTRTLLILMKAKVIIQKEAEEEAFPTFSALGGGGA